MNNLKFFLITSVALTLVACGGGDKKDVPVKTPTQTTQSAPKVEKPTVKPEPKPLPKPAIKPAETKPVATPPAAQPKRTMSGKRLYMRRSCLACHGKNGAKGIQDYPNIAGLDASYSKSQIKDIVAGKRKGGADALTGAPRAESMRGALVTPDGEARITSEEITIIAA